MSELASTQSQIHPHCQRIQRCTCPVHCHVPKLVDIF